MTARTRYLIDDWKRYIEQALACWLRDDPRGRQYYAAKARACEAELAEMGEWPYPEEREWHE